MSLRDKFIKKQETKKALPPTSVISRPVIPRPRPPRTPKSVQMSEEKLANVVGQVLEEKLQTLTQTLENQAKLIQQYQSLSPRLWNEVNRFEFMQEYSRKDKKGFKKVEMYRYFGSSQVTWADVDLVVEEYHKLGILRKNRDGWYKLTKKGREYHQNLKEANI